MQYSVNKIYKYKLEVKQYFLGTYLNCPVSDSGHIHIITIIIFNLKYNWRFKKKNVITCILVNMGKISLWIKITDGKCL